MSNFMPIVYIKHVVLGIKNLFLFKTAIIIKQNILKLCNLKMQKFFKGNSYEDFSVFYQHIAKIK